MARQRVPDGGAGLRLGAARVISKVEGGASLDGALREASSGLERRDAAFLKALCYGTLRLYPRLECLLAELSDRPLARLEPQIKALLCAGLYQILEMRIPAHAAVAETVAAAHRVRRGAAAGLVNAVLRRFLREREQIERRIAGDEVARHAHPRWLIELLRSDWPDGYAAILDAGNRPPPLWLRVNLARGSRSGYLRQLQECSFAAAESPWSPSALRLEVPVDVVQLPGFADGLVSVQDAAAQLAAPLLGAEPGLRVLDACAAPGGKATHLLELCPALDLTALDSDATRLRLVEESLARLRLTARVLHGDAAEPVSWWDGRPFDRILLDAPCTATGVIRRHPDIKLLRRPADLGAATRRQHALLAALWPLLRRGGRLLYATCSVLAAENGRQVAAFLADHPGACEETIPASWGRKSGPGRQVLPGEDDMDGFYYACLTHATGAA